MFASVNVKLVAEVSELVPSMSTKKEPDNPAPMSVIVYVVRMAWDGDEKTATVNRNAKMIESVRGMSILSMR
jgi:hypothetical protein